VKVFSRLQVVKNSLNFTIPHIQCIQPTHGDEQKREGFRSHGATQRIVSIWRRGTAT